MKQFDQIFDALVKQIPNDLRPRDDAILLQYTNAFYGKFGFMLRDKFPENLEKEKEWPSNIEENMLASKVEPFHAPREKDEAKLSIVINVNPISDTIMSIEKKFDQMTTEILNS